MAINDDCGGGGTGKPHEFGPDGICLMCLHYDYAYDLTPQIGGKAKNLAAHMARMRKASGEVNIDSHLVSFLYTLLRDHVTPGVIEDILLNHCRESRAQYSNGWLARYAEDVANRLLAQS